MKENYKNLLTTQTTAEQMQQPDNNMYSMVTQVPQDVALTPPAQRKKNKQKNERDKASGNIFGAVWQASSLTRNIETIKNMTPEDKQKLENAYEKMDKFQHSNILKKGAMTPFVMTEQIIANIAHGNAWEEAQAFGAATAGGIVLGAIGGLAGGAIGGMLGGAGAAAGYTAGKYLGHVMGGMYSYGRVAEGKTVNKFKAAGYDIEKSTNAQAIVSLVHELPVALLVGGAFGGYLKAAPFIKRAAKSAAPYAKAGATATAEYAGAAGRKAQEYAKRFVQSEMVQSKVADVKAQVSRVYEPAKTFAGEMLGVAHRTANVVGEMAGEAGRAGIKYAREKAGEAGRAGIKYAREKAAEYSPFVEKMIKDVKDYVIEDYKEMYEYAKPYIDEIVKKSGGALKSAAEIAAEYIGEKGLVQKAGEIIKPAVEKAGEIIKPAVEKAGEMAKKAGEIIEPIVEKTKEKAKPYAFAASMSIAQNEWAQTTAYFIQKTMQTAWAHAVNAKNVAVKNTISTDWAKKQWKIMNGGAVDRKGGTKPFRTPPTGYSTTSDVKEPQIKQSRYNMADTLQAGEPWKIEQVEVTEKKVVDGVEKEITRKVWEFSEEGEIKSTEQVAAHVLEKHKEIMEKLDPVQREHYLFGTAQNVDSVAGGLEHIYKNVMMDGLFENEGQTISGKELGVIFKDLIKNEKAMTDFVKYLMGEEVDLSSYHQSFRKYADNYMKYLAKSSEHTRRLGIAQQELNHTYLPQYADTYKITAAGTDTVIADLIAWMDHEYMGNETPEAQLTAAKAISESFYDQDALKGTLNAGFSGTLSQKKRVMHFKDADSYIKFMRKYGVEDNPVEAINGHVTRMGRAQAVVTQFGPDAKENYKAMIGFLGAEQPKGLVDSLASTSRRKGIINIYNGLFGDTVTNYVTKDWLVPSAIRAYKMADSIGRNIMTKNNIIYELLETPLNMAFLKQYYGANELSGHAITMGFKNMVSGLNRLITGELHPDAKKAMADVGLEYELWNMLFPHKYGKGNTYDIPLKAREFNHFISKLKGTDTLHHFNMTKTAMQMQHDFGLEIKSGKSWNDLKPAQRGLFQSHGINEHEYGIISANQDVFLREFGDMQTIFGTPENPNQSASSANKSASSANLSDIKIHLLGYTEALRSEEKDIHAIGLKLAAMQHEFVRQANNTGTSISNMAFLGKAATSNDAGSFMIRNLFAFRGYIFDRLARSGAKMDLEGHSPNMNKYAKFAWQRMQVGLAVNALRYAAAGKKPEMDGIKDWIEFMANSSAKGDLFPLSILSELFEDSYTTRENGFAGNLSALAGKTAGPGISYSLGKAYDAIDMAKAASDGDSEKTFKKMRRLTPGGNWLPTDFIFNRILLDNIFTAIDEEGAYDLFKKEIKNQNKRNFKHFIAPGELTKTDSVGLSGLEQERNDLLKQAKSERKLGKTGKYTEIREKQKLVNKEIKKLEKKKKVGDDEGNAQIQHEIDKLSATSKLEMAMHYAKNKPKGMSNKQVKKVLENALEEFKNTEGV
jgi:hypothetical protein